MKVQGPSNAASVTLNLHKKGIWTDTLNLFMKGKKPFECNNCGTKFQSKSDLNRHVKSVHEGKKRSNLKNTLSTQIVPG